VHFALLPEEVAGLEAIDDEGGRLEHLEEKIEVRYFESARDYLAQSDKSWDAMHPTFADGELTWESGDTRSTTRCSPAGRFTPATTTS
jgi:hypothetical protein